MTLRRFSLAAGLGAVLVAAGCHQEELMTPPTPAYTGGATFQRYVSLGNSITAGFQSGGINDSTQQRSYAVLMATAMGGDVFYRPSLVAPGCPPPIDTLFTATGVPHRLFGTTAATCAYRSKSTPPYVSNVAVPGATVVDPFHTGPTISANALTLLILGGRSQVQAMSAVQPTFVSVWIGNNDVLGAATNATNAGNPALVTPAALFQARYDSMLAAIDATPSIRGGILIGVADVAALPYFSYGQIYFAAFGAGQQPNFTVLPNCAPSAVGGVGDTVLVPFPYGFALLGQAKAGVPATLDCTDDHNIEPAELANLHAMVAAYNTFISGRATTRGWAYVNPNIVLATLRADPTQVAIFPNTAATSCNGNGASGSPFGLAFSCDGIHPSTASHHLIAQTLVQAINLKYGSAIPAVP